MNSNIANESYAALVKKLEPTAYVNHTKISNNSLWKMKLPFDNVGVAVAVSFIIPMAIIGIICNVITIAVISRSEKLRSIFNLYIISLSVSDLLSALISPLMLYRRTWGFKEWKIPAFLCRVYWGGDLITSISTSLHILVFCGLRFLAIAKPHLFGRIQMIYAKISILILWLVSSFVGAFTFGLWHKIFDKERTKYMPYKNLPHCTVDLKWFYYVKKFSLYGNSVFYYTPLVGVTILTTAIISLLLHRRNERIKNRRKRENQIDEAEIIRHKKEKQAVAQLVLIVVSYLFGYIPISMFYLLAPRLQNPPVNWWFNVIAYICMRFSECLNPFFYNLGSSTLRSETMKLLRQIFCCKPNSQQNNSTSSNTGNKSGTQSSRLQISSTISSTKTTHF